MRPYKYTPPSLCQVENNTVEGWVLTDYSPSGYVVWLEGPRASYRDPTFHILTPCCMAGIDWKSMFFCTQCKNSTIQIEYKTAQHDTGCLFARKDYLSIAVPWISAWTGYPQESIQIEFL